MPKSSTNFALNFTCCLLFFLLIFIFKLPGTGLSDVSVYMVLILTVLPMLFYEFYNSQKTYGENALPFKAVRKFSFERLLLKLFGLIITYSFIAFLFWLIPFYSDQMFAPFWPHLKRLLPIIGVLAVPYFAYVDMRVKEPFDVYWQLGNIIFGRFKLVDRRLVWEHLKGWLVKGFFLPLMSVFVLQNLSYFYNLNVYHLLTPADKFSFLNNILFTADLLFSVFGYLLTLRMFNSQIFSAEPTVLGWVVCLCGYPPFWSELMFNRFFNYEDSFGWMDLFGNMPILFVIWCGLIIACLLIYSMATIAFGFHFSNLTYRGLITGGPYKFCKHPAYVFKNLSWWLVSVPFFPNAGWEHALRTSILLLGINCTYFLRARTEENHLSNYPEYVEYAEYMNENSIFAWLGRLIPFFKYSKERAFISGSKTYKPFKN